MVRGDTFAKNILPQNLFGLSEGEALRRLQDEGRNELPQTEKRTFLKIVFEIFLEPMVLLLVGCGVVTFLLGDKTEAAWLLGFVAVIAGMTIRQEGKTEKALEALKELSSPRALVIREGQQKRIAGSEVVREDLVLLAEGDRVPADGLLLSANNLVIDESLLTGESVPVIKKTQETVFAGTMVVKGSALAQIQHTGGQCELGKIGKAIQRIEETPTALQKETQAIVKKLAMGVGVLALGSALAYGLQTEDWLEGILSALTLAMAILPNELPAVLMIFLSMGAWRLSQQRVLTRKNPAIETLGSATLLCVDKTGTLTQNRMTIRSLWTLQSEITVEAFQDSSRPLPEEFHALIEFGILAGEKEPLDPMDRAFNRVGELELLEAEHLHPDWKLVEQYPITPQLLALSHVWKSVEGQVMPVAAKGAPEAIIDLCHLPEKKAKLIEDKVTEMGNQGLRVLGVARSVIRDGALPEKQHDLDFEFLGLVGLYDPIRPEVPPAIKECRRAGLRILMITGDHPETALSIAREMGLPEGKALTGDDIDRFSDDELKIQLSQVSVCARTIPSQKLRLVNLLNEMGEVVAMTGDGVNDAPALKAAAVGIAMGARGTDVAREAASIVLLDDDFGSIVAAIKTGRAVFENLRQAMSYLFSIHLPIAGISLAPALFGLPLIFLPIHIAVLHLVIEPACSLVFSAEEKSVDLMGRKPRPLSEGLFSKEAVQLSLKKGFVILGMMFLVGGISQAIYPQMESLRTLAFLSLLLMNLGLLPLKARWLVGGTVVFVSAAFFWAPMRELLNLQQLNLGQCLIGLAGSTLTIFLLKKVFKK